MLCNALSLLMCILLYSLTLILLSNRFDLFVSEMSAKEMGTSRASMNRTGKTRAAQGVKKHYNEYKDFLQREVDAHICASFMEMLDMKNLDGKYY